MYKPKKILHCDMPAADKALNVLVLNASLKHEPAVSNTGELSDLVLKYMKEFGKIESESVRLADKNLPVGLGFKESKGDEWPGVTEKMKKADIIIFATPIWWGGRSSLMQRVIERMDAFDEDATLRGKSALYNKVAGIVITGNEDGALSTMGSLMTVLTWMGFLLPPECCAYWVGEVGGAPSKEAETRRKNKATDYMAKILARNLVYYGQMQKKHEMQFKNIS